MGENNIRSKIDEVIRTRSLSVKKEKYLSGELYVLMDQIQIRLTKIDEELFAMKEVVTRHSFCPHWKHPSIETLKVRDLQQEYGKKYIEAIEKERSYWMRKKVENSLELIYHENLLYSFLGYVV
ncbi:hypothetical protein CsatB_001532 [Cannabis sativa]